MSNYHRNRIAAANTSIDELEKGPTYYSSPTPTQSTVTNGYLDRRRIRGRYNIEDWVLFVILFLMFLAILAILAIFIAVIVKVVQLSNAAERLIGTDSPLGSFISRLLSGST
uniref:Movement protein n=1 Tax=Panagrellus redivivus TaxID=6233 RepID=A0A7E4VV48_PANRE